MQLEIQRENIVSVFKDYMKGKELGDISNERTSEFRSVNLTVHVSP